MALHPRRGPLHQFLVHVVGMIRVAKVVDDARIHAFDLALIEKSVNNEFELGH